MSFEVKEVWDKIPEIEEVKQSLEKGEQTVQMFMKIGKVKEA